MPRLASFGRPSTCQWRRSVLSRFQTLGSGGGGSECLISGAPVRWPEWRRACRTGGRGHHVRLPAIPGRRERAPSWRAAALRASSGRGSGSAPHESRARRRAWPLHPTAACRKLPCGTLRSPRGPPPRNADLGGPPVWGRGPVSRMCSCVLMPRSAGHPTLWPCCKHPHRCFRGASLQLRRRTRRA